MNKRLITPGLIIVLVLASLFIFIKINQIKSAQETEFEFLVPTIGIFILFFITTTIASYFLEKSNIYLIITAYAISGAVCSYIWQNIIPYELFTLKTTIFIGLASGVYLSLQNHVFWSSHKR